MTRLAHLWLALRSSLWFVPGLMVLGGVALAIGLIRLDLYLPGSFVNGYARLLTTSPEGARAMLESIAGSMITVAGVVFSITIVTLSLASSQYSPRVLRGFMKDSTNQVVLGVFVGIFAYCLVVLGAIRTDVLTFVPSIAVLVGGVLALVAVGFLIRFIHHTAVSIQASDIIALVTAETLATVDRLHGPPRGAEEDRAAPGSGGDGPGASTGESGRAAVLADGPIAVHWKGIARSPTHGYVQRFDPRALLVVAEREDVVLRAEYRVGEFVVEGAPLLSVAGRGTGRDVDAELVAAWTLGHQRTVEQDPAWGIRQLADIAARALSPGINDATTAVTCLHYLGAILQRVAASRVPEAVHRAGGRLRLLTPATNPAELAALAFGDIRHAARGTPRVLSELLHAIERLALAPAAVAALDLPEQLKALAETIERTVDSPTERRALLVRAARLAGRFADPGARAATEA